MNALAIDYVPPNRNREGHIVGADALRHSSDLLYGEMTRRVTKGALS